MARYFQAGRRQTTKEFIELMAEGNDEATEALKRVDQERSAFPIVLLDMQGVYGERLATLFWTVCDGYVSNLVALVNALQYDLVTTAMVDGAIQLAIEDVHFEPFDFDALKESVDSEKSMRRKTPSR